MRFEARWMHAGGIVEEGWGQIEAGPTDICKTGRGLAKRADPK